MLQKSRCKNLWFWTEFQLAKRFAVLLYLAMTTFSDKSDGLRFLARLTKAWET